MTEPNQPSPKPQPLEYETPRGPRPGLPWQMLVAIPLIIAASLTPCICGHFNWVSLAFTAPAACFACWGFFRRRQGGIWQIIVWAALILASLEFAKNVADILWFGHDPLLP